MKIIQSFFKLTAMIILGLSIIFGSMFYQSWRSESNARQTCKAITVGKYFDKQARNSKTPFLVKEINSSYYLYAFPMTFESLARCKIFVDENNIVIRNEFDIL